MDSAVVLTDAHSAGMKIGWTISPFASLEFSKSGQRLFFGTAPARAPKDTSLVDIDLVKLDIWHYNDDYLQPQQLKNLDRELKRSYRAMYDFTWSKMIQLADEDIPDVLVPDENDGNTFVGITDKGKRIQGQWEGNTRKDIYVISAETGKRVLIRKDLDGSAQISPAENTFTGTTRKQGSTLPGGTALPATYHPVSPQNYMMRNLICRIIPIIMG